MASRSEKDGRLRLWDPRTAHPQSEPLHGPHGDTRDLAFSSASMPLPLVLDTNVVLDLLVFDDPHVRPLAQALSAGEVTAWADAETLKELELVLAYPSFALDEVARRALHERYQGLVRMAPEDPGTPPPPLPRCRDRDDQKFLVLAARVGASWLVSKDKRVLALAGHKQVPFDILTSRQMAERLRQRER